MIDNEIKPKSWVSPIANPLASDKTQKRCFKLLSKLSNSSGPTTNSQNKLFVRGVAEVTKQIKKGKKGILFLATDIYPIDVISHLPVLAEESSVPYVYLSSKDIIGSYLKIKRPTSAILVFDSIDAEESKKLYDKCFKTITR